MVPKDLKERRVFKVPKELRARKEYKEYKVTMGQQDLKVSKDLRVSKDLKDSAVKRGFVTNTGKFVDRKKAAKIAKKAGFGLEQKGSELTLIVAHA